MNTNNFLSFLQQLLTMVDPDNEASRVLAYNALNSVVALANTSGKADASTLRMMEMARIRFSSLLKQRKYFMGVPGELQINEMKRIRLGDFLDPHC